MRTEDQSRKLEQVQRASDILHTVADRYARLRWLAENDASGAFIDLAAAAGELTVANLAKLSTLLELLERSASRPETVQYFLNPPGPRTRFVAWREP